MPVCQATGGTGGASDHGETLRYGGFRDDIHSHYCGNRVQAGAKGWNVTDQDGIDKDEKILGRTGKICTLEERITDQDLRFAAQWKVGM